MIKWIYVKIIKPILFKFPADDVHEMFLKRGRMFGKSNFFKNIFSKIFVYKNKNLEQSILGIQFENPIGLSAGFDYDADLIDILPSVGFGYHTIGTVTNLPYEGNPRPMLGRLPKSKSLLVNKGFKSMGIDSILKKINKRPKGIPLGISIGSTNQCYKVLDEMVNDIVISFDKANKQNYFDYFELNVSCPNLINQESLPDKLDSKVGFTMLLLKLNELNLDKPVFVKMYLEKTIEETLFLLEIAEKFSFIKGFIFSNLAKNRNNPSFDKEEIEHAGRGNFSGKPTELLSNNLISAVYEKYRDRYIIIGTGGVFTGDDAYEKIKRGASLIQLITGMVYSGPSQIGIINKRISELLERDGYKNISEVIGTYSKK